MKQLILLFFLPACLVVQGQADSEILLFDILKEGDSFSISNGRNITKHKGYDNQPFFHPRQSLIYYASFDDSSRSDIRVYNYKTGETKNLTLTKEREYSPTVMPDENDISCILQSDNGAQELVKYPIQGGSHEVLIFHLKIGYHAWAGDKQVFLFVLEDSARNSLHNYHLEKNADTVVAENIGRSLHRIQGQHAMSFVQKISDKLSVIKRYDLATGRISNIIYTIPGQDHLTWLNDGTILMSDGKNIFYHRYSSQGELKDKQWKPVKIRGDHPALKGLSRLAVNAANDKLAVVAAAQ